MVESNGDTSELGVDFNKLFLGVASPMLESVRGFAAKILAEHNTTFETLSEDGQKKLAEDAYVLARKKMWTEVLADQHTMTSKVQDVWQKS